MGSAREAPRDANRSFASWLREQRRARDLTQAELAERVGCTAVTIHKIERGERRPSRQMIERILDELEVPLESRADIVVAAREAATRGEAGAGRTGTIKLKSDALPSRLPQPVASIVGRDDDLAQIVRILQGASRLLTIVGPPGVGKSRLALEVAHRLLDAYANRVYLVELDPLSDAALVPQTVARVLAIPQEPGRPVEDTLVEALGSKRILLVLDNCEYMLNACARLISLLLPACPGLQILATSRRLLRITAEHVYDVAPLAVPPPRLHQSVEQLATYAAVQLFVERAQAVSVDFALSVENAVAVAEICARLDGLPLAIELAATRVRFLPAQALLARLQRRLPLLTGGGNDLPSRQQTLQATIAWSYDLLDELDKGFYRRLSVFVGGWTLDAADAVVAENGDALASLEALASQSLIQRQGKTAEDLRFTNLDTLREFGSALLLGTAEEKATRRRHAEYFLGLVEESVCRYTGEGPGSLRGWDRRLIGERGNLRAALEWCRDNDPILGLRLATGLGWFWITQADLVEGEDWLTSFLATPLGDLGLRGRALLALGTFKRNRGEITAAQPLLEEGLALCRQAGDRWGIARGLALLVQQARTAGKYADGIALAKESLAIAREIRVVDSIVWALTDLSQLYRLQGDLDQSRAYLEETLRLSPRAEFALYWLGRIAEDEGEYDRAATLFSEGLTSELRSDWLLLLGRVTRKRGDRCGARRLAESGLDCARRHGMSPHVCWALYDLAELDWSDGDQERGNARLTEGLYLAQQLRNRQYVAIGLLVVAKEAADSGQLRRAIRLFAAAERIIPEYRFERESHDLPAYKRSLATVRKAVESSVFAVAWAEGRAMSSDEAVAYALEDSRGAIETF